MEFIKYGPMAYDLGLIAARYILDPKSYGYNPDFDFLEAAKDLFDPNHFKLNISEFMRAINDYKLGIVKIA